jgi:formyl-CoA transferase
VCIAAAGDVLFPRLCAAIGRDDLPNDARFSTLERRAENADAINDVVAGWCRERTAGEIEKILVANQVPVSRVYAADEIVADPQVQARDAVVSVEDPVLGPVRQQAPVPRLDRTPLRIPRGAPRLGEHTDEVLRELLGLGDEEIDSLRTDRVI